MGNKASAPEAPPAEVSHVARDSFWLRDYVLVSLFFSHQWCESINLLNRRNQKSWESRRENQFVAAAPTRKSPVTNVSYSRERKIRIAKNWSRLTKCVYVTRDLMWNRSMVGGSTGWYIWWGLVDSILCCNERIRGEKRLGLCIFRHGEKDWLFFLETLDDMIRHSRNWII